MDGRRLASFFLRAASRNSTGAKARARQLVNIVRTKVTKVNICPVVTIRKTCFRLLLAHPRRRHPTSANDWNFEEKLYREKSAPTNTISVTPTSQSNAIPNGTCDNEPSTFTSIMPRFVDDPRVAPGRNITADNLICSLSLVKCLLSSSTSTVVGTSKTDKRFPENGAL